MDSDMHADCVLSDFDGFRVLRATTGSTASFVGCTLANNYLMASEDDVAVIQTIADTSGNGSLVRPPPRPPAPTWGFSPIGLPEIGTEEKL